MNAERSCYETLTYDDGDFTYTPMTTADTIRNRAAELAAAGMENVTITTYTLAGKRRKTLLTERVWVATILDDGTPILAWSTTI